MTRWTLLAAFAALITISGSAQPMTLAADGKTEYVISVAADAIAPEKTAATELQTYLQQATGADFPIVDEAQAAGPAKRIVVGPSAAFKAACPDVDLAALKHDGIVLRTVGDTLYLAGGRPRGTLYAVYTFLEDVVGCRWWSSDASFVPDRPLLRVDALDTVYTPKLQYREAFYRNALRNPLFAATLKLNGHFENIPDEYGGHYRIIGWCHTFNQILPPGKYFAQHPEWYSEIDGARKPSGAQLCLTNEEMKAEFIKNALEWVRKDPDAGMISISQNDCHGACQCAACKAIEEEEGSPSGPIVRFVNDVAEAIEAEFPDMLIETLAYSYSRKAPKLVKPRKNVLIRLCSIECSFAQPLGEGDHNETFRADAEAWSAVAPQLYVWDYVTNFRNYILPHPNLRVIAPNIRFFVENRAIGLFEQGDSGCSCSDFPELRAWLMAHLMWDPSLDPDELISEFMEGFYGPASEPLLAYIELIHDAVEEAGTKLRCYMANTSAWFPLEDVNRATQLFDDAAKLVADDPVLAARVRRARLPLDHVWIQGYYSLKDEAAIDGAPFNGPEDLGAFCDEFVETANRFDVGSYREGAAFEGYASQLKSICRPPGPPPDMCKDLPAGTWLDIQDQKFSLFGQGNLAVIVPDPKAADGFASRMPGSHFEWATQYPINKAVEKLGPCHCYVVVRCDAKAETGPALQVGIYDNGTSSGVMAVTRTIEELSGPDYKTLDMGVYSLKPGMYLWFAPNKNPDQVEAVYIDRAFFIKEDQVRDEE